MFQKWNYSDFTSCITVASLTIPIVLRSPERTLQGHFSRGVILATIQLACFNTSVEIYMDQPTMGNKACLWIDVGLRIICSNCTLLPRWRFYLKVTKPTMFNYHMKYNTKSHHIMITKRANSLSVEDSHSSMACT